MSCSINACKLAALIINAPTEGILKAGRSCHFTNEILRDLLAGSTVQSNIGSHAPPMTDILNNVVIRASEGHLFYDIYITVHRKHTAWQRPIKNGELLK